VLNPDTALLAQIFPKSTERLCGRRHAPSAHKLIELVCSGRNPVTKEQQDADFPVQILRISEIDAETFDLDGELVVADALLARGAFGIHDAIPPNQIS
jgi:hypothetical protein